MGLGHVTEVPSYTWDLKPETQNTESGNWDPYDR